MRHTKTEKINSFAKSGPKSTLFNSNLILLKEISHGHFTLPHMH